MSFLIIKTTKILAFWLRLVFVLLGPLVVSDTFGADPVRFAIIGDFGGGSSVTEGGVAAAVQSWAPDFVVTTGDNRYGIDFDTAVGQFYCDFIKDGGSGPFCSGGNSVINAFFPVLGNHDYDDGSGLNEYLDYFTLPGTGISTSGTSGNERYYDFVEGPVHLFMIDAEGARDSAADMTAQMTWLQEQLASSGVPWKIVFLHRPPYSSGSQGSNSSMQWPFASWGAVAVIAGHDHTYERIARDGISYFVNGLGGESIFTILTPVAGSQIRYNDDFGAMLVNASDTTIQFEFINLAGEIIDTYMVDVASPLNYAPSSDFIRGCVGLDCTFTDTSSDTDGSITGWLWDFGDGATSTQQHPLHSYAAAGSYTVTLTVTDDSGLIDSSSQPLIVAEPGTTVPDVLEVRIIQSTDDAEERLDTGYMYMNSSDLELIQDRDREQLIGLRFQYVGIPQGATITAAYLEFQVDETDSVTTLVNISAQAADNAAEFSSTDYDLTSRATIPASVAWDIPPWDAVGEVHQSPDLSPVIQAIVDRPGWVINNSQVLVISGSGTRTAVSYDDIPEAAPLLHVEYTIAGF